MVDVTTNGRTTSMAVPMRVQVLGVERGRRIASEAVTRLRATVSTPIKATTAQVRFNDENGPKGGVAIRCAITVKMPRRAPVHVQDVALSPRLALDRALVKLGRRLSRLREGRRTVARRPKKYFAAAQELLKP